MGSKMIWVVSCGGLFANVNCIFLSCFKYLLLQSLENSESTNNFSIVSSPLNIMSAIPTSPREH